MSIIPSHGGPSTQGFIDHSHHETSYGSYTNTGYHSSGHGILNINPQYQYQYSSSNPLEELEKRASPSAAVDSAARFDPPRCSESTRLGIMQTIEEWVNDNEDEPMRSSLFWLHGGAGVGKSAIAQSLSEKFQEKKQLAANFFFSKTDATRNNGDQLIPTLVSQLLDTFEGIVPFVEHRIRKNRALFTKRYQIQFRELLVEPLLVLKSTEELVTHPRFIVIDGLDECENPDVQSELLQVIAAAIPHIPYPLRFLVTSRPEAHIMEVFHHDRDIQAITVHRYNLSNDPDADMDIRKFLETEFVKIRRVHRLGRHLPHAWPGRKTITSLVERSSGHFIYASTVIRYIRSPKHRPDDRLEVVLCLRPPQEVDQPYAQLDELYSRIFAGVESHAQLEKICLVLGILYLQRERAGLFNSVPRGVAIEDLLEMKAGDLVLLLDPILSLIAADGNEIHILHKSLIDFLLDFARGGHLPFDLARVHELAATYLLKQRLSKDPCNIRDVRDFAYHCHYAYLNNALKDHLHSLKASFPKFVMATSEDFPPWRHHENDFMQSSIWHFFRTLGREDFDSTGLVYEQYATSWMDYLHSTFPMRTATLADYMHPIVTPAPRQGRPIVAQVDGLKCVLERVLKEWKPQNVNLMVGGMDPRRPLAYIKHIQREHDVFSAYAKASFPGNPNMIASSLVFGEHFIHSYNFGIWKTDETFLNLQTYSRNGHVCYRDVFVITVGSLYIVRETRVYLKKLEQYLFSDLYQKYGAL